MRSRRRVLRLAVYLVPLSLGVLLAAAPPPESSPDDLIRAANAAYLRGDADEADRLYTAAEERTADPGLVAFNKAAVHFQKGEFREAELLYARALDDRACPPERAARAWFNRGTCLLRRGGSPAVYRSAVVCFERCLDAHPADEPLKADARHNLELAKLLWAEANRKAARPESPNEPPPELDPPPPLPQPSPGDQQPGPPEAGTGNDAKGQQPVQQPTPVPVPKSGASPTDAKTAGNNPNLQPLLNEDRPQQLSPEDTREYLKRTEERLRKERQGMLKMLYGPDRPGVRDW